MGGGFPRIFGNIWELGTYQNIRHIFRKMSRRFFGNILENFEKFKNFLLTTNSNKLSEKYFRKNQRKNLVFESFRKTFRKVFPKNSTKKLPKIPKSFPKKSAKGFPSPPLSYSFKILPINLRINIWQTSLHLL